MKCERLTGWPSNAVRSGPAFAVGAAFATSTASVSSPTPPSSSRTRTVTAYFPSSAYTWLLLKVPEPSNSVSDANVLVVWSPQSITAECVSLVPRSLKSMLTESKSPSLTFRSTPASMTGATLRAVTLTWPGSAVRPRPASVTNRRTLYTPLSKGLKLKVAS